MYLMDRAARIRAVALAATLLGLPAGAPAAAAELPQGPAETTGAFHAEAFASLPENRRIEVRLLDDSPENLELGWRIHEELQRHGLVRQDGQRLVLSIDTEVSVVTSEEDGRQSDTPDGTLDVLGFLRATLDDPAEGARLWAAEAVYQRSDGDLPAGARSLAPLLVQQIGRSVQLDDVRVR